MTVRTFDTPLPQAARGEGALMARLSPDDHAARIWAEAQARQIALSRAKTLAWVSCDPVTFARDARILADQGLSISRIYVIDQFRWSPHVETVAEIRRR